jgi:polysaccharide export outer membrane protein
MRERYEEFGMKLSFARHDGSRRLLVCVAASLLAGCTLIPGNQNYGNREESDVRLPVQQGDLLAPANIKIRPITAELIIDMFKVGAAADWRWHQLREGGDEGQSAFHG